MSCGLRFLAQFRLITAFSQGEKGDRAAVDEGSRSELKDKQATLLPTLHISSDPVRGSKLITRIAHTGGRIMLAIMLSALGSTGFSAKRTKQNVDQMMQSLSNWGRWGKDDQLGTL